MKVKLKGYYIVIIVLIIIFCIVTYFYKYKSFNLYIGTNPRDNIYFNGYDVYTNTTVNTSKVYKRYVSSKDDALNLIKEDAEKQKVNCHNNSATIKEVENNLENHYGISGVNLCELSDDYAKNIESVFAFLYQEFPNLPKYLTNISLTNIDDNIVASFKFNQLFATNGDNLDYPIVYKVSLLLNSKFVLNQDYLSKIIIISSSNHYFPNNATNLSPVAHEIGHYLSFAIQAKEYDLDEVSYFKESDSALRYQQFYQDRLLGQTSKQYLEEAMLSYNQKYDIKYNDIKYFSKAISHYAASDNSYDEAIAEAFNDYYLNGNQAKLESLEIISILKKHLEAVVDE